MSFVAPIHASNMSQFRGKGRENFSSRFYEIPLICTSQNPHFDGFETCESSGSFASAKYAFKLTFWIVQELPKP